MSDPRAGPKTYMSIEDQAKLNRRLTLIKDRTHWTELLFLKHGQYIASGALALCGLSMWRVGYFAWNIDKYSKGRVLTAIISTCFSPAGGMIYNITVQDRLFQPYRKENMWYYGFEAVLSHQVCLLLQGGFSLGYTFTTAQMAGIIPVENKFANRKHRKNTLNYVLARLAPFKNRLIAINVLSSAFIFCLAARSYTESCHLLRKVNRKTFAEIED